MARAVATTINVAALASSARSSPPGHYPSRSPGPSATPPRWECRPAALTPITSPYGATPRSQGTIARTPAIMSRRPAWVRSAVPPGVRSAVVASMLGTLSHPAAGSLEGTWRSPGDIGRETGCTAAAMVAAAPLTRAEEAWRDLRVRRVRARPGPVPAAPDSGGATDRAPGVRRARPADPRATPRRPQGGAARHRVGQPVRERVGAHERHQGRPTGDRRRRPTPGAHPHRARPRLPVRGRPRRAPR